MINTVKAQLLEAGGLDESKLENALSHSLSKGADFADLYFQSSRMESWMLEDKKVKSGSHSIDAGVGVRINNGEKTGFAYSDAMTNEGMLQAVTTASSIANTNKKLTQLKFKWLNDQIFIHKAMF